MNDIDVEGQFVYTDGTDVDYVNWHPYNPNNNSPNTNCVYIFITGAMVDIQCHYRFNFMCKCKDCYIKTHDRELEIKLN